MCLQSGVGQVAPSWFESKGSASHRRGPCSCVRYASFWSVAASLAYSNPATLPPPCILLRTLAAPSVQKLQRCVLRTSKLRRYCKTHKRWAPLPGSRRTFSLHPGGFLNSSLGSREAFRCACCCIAHGANPTPVRWALDSGVPFQLVKSLFFSLPILETDATLSNPRLFCYIRAEAHSRHASWRQDHPYEQGSGGVSEALRMGGSENSQELGLQILCRGFERGEDEGNTGNHPSNPDTARHLGSH